MGTRGASLLLLLLQAAPDATRRQTAWPFGVLSYADRYFRLTLPHYHAAVRWQLYGGSGLVSLL